MEDSRKSHPASEAETDSLVKELEGLGRNNWTESAWGTITRYFKPLKAADTRYTVNNMENFYNLQYFGNIFIGDPA